MIGFDMQQLLIETCGFNFLPAINLQYAKATEKYNQWKLSVVWKQEEKAKDTDQEDKKGIGVGWAAGSPFTRSAALLIFDLT